MGSAADCTFDAIVVGAGVSGLTAAALLSHAGARVVTLEKHTIAGGCASFYQRKNFRFDVGATLAGGFGERGVHTAIFGKLGIELKTERIEPSMCVHLPDARIVRYGDSRWKAERRRAFGAECEPFWLAQERIAGAAWDFSSRFPALPVDVASLAASARALRPAQLPLLEAFGRTVADLYPSGAGRRLRAFVDAQLMITAQACAEDVDLAYGATALDLAREGTFHLAGGVGAIATALARCVRKNGGTIAYATQAHSIETRGGRVTGVLTSDGRLFSAPRVVSALPIFDTIDRCSALRGTSLDRRARAFPQRWGAFTVYCGVPDGAIAEDLAAHHQLVESYDAPLGEGNSTFVSVSMAGERGRAPGGGRAITISTHTDVARWERAQRDGTIAALRAAYQRRLLGALERIAPGAAALADVLENATPLTFARYTGRKRGLAGGFPQTRELANLAALSHRTPIAGLFQCGDTVFPGQSTVGATLSGVAAARAALRT